MREEITKELLDERFIFNLETGVVTNRIKTSRNTMVGVEAGCSGPYGYRVISINGRKHYTARIIWFFVHGEWPTNIDHVNHLKTDNRLINLRNVSQAENNRNMSKSSNNTSGVSGVSWHKAASKWQAQIMGNGKAIHLGLFNNMADAITARSNAKVEFGFFQNHA